MTGTRQSMRFSGKNATIAVGLAVEQNKRAHEQVGELELNKRQKQSELEAHTLAPQTTVDVAQISYNLIEGLSAADLDYSSEYGDDQLEMLNADVDVFMNFAEGDGAALRPQKADTVLPSSQPSEDPIEPSQLSQDVQAVPQAVFQSFGFINAAGVALKPVSEEAKREAARLFDESSTDLVVDLAAQQTPTRPHADHPKRSMVMTAGGSALPPVSDAAKAQAEAMFDESAAASAPPTSTPQGFMTASGKPLSPPSTETKAQVDALWARSAAEPSLGIASSPTRQLQAGTSFVSPRKAAASQESEDEYDVFAEEDWLAAAALEEDLSASTVPKADLSSASVPEIIPMVVSFASAGKKPLKKPGPAALLKAHKILEEVDAEVDLVSVVDVESRAKVQASALVNSATMPGDATPDSAAGLETNASHLPEAVVTAVMEQPLGLKPIATPARRLNGGRAMFTTPRPATFASPLPKRLATPIRAAQTPVRLPLSVTTNTMSRPPVTPLAGAKTPFKPQSSFQTPVRRVGLGITPRAKRGARSSSSFSVPFLKAGVGPATPVQSPAVRARPGAKPVPTFVPPTPVFDLQAVGPRLDMKQSYLRPHYYDELELLEKGMLVSLPSELFTIDVSNAEHYAFRVDGTNQTPATTYELLLKSDCPLLSLLWVTNHWRLILWKLAGQVRARPQLLAEKWLWQEVVNQLKYRYEREYNNAHRSCIKRIQERDASAGMPMVLCVAAVYASDTSEGTENTFPILELTDGWYRIQAGTDPALRDAVKRGALKVGYKLAISGAKLDSHGEGRDVLQALNKTHLIISGNSTSLVRWSTKLGRQEKAFVASIRSLTPHGGVVPLMDVRVTRVFPLAFVDSAKGSTTGPWSADEEATLQDQWDRKYADESERLQAELNTRLERVQDVVQTLSSAVSDGPVESEKDISSDVEDEFEALLHVSSLHVAVSRLSNSDVAHMAQYGHMYLENERVSGANDIQRELKSLCPPRNVRNFRIIRFDDAQDYFRRTKDRSAQLNVWDAVGLGDNLIVQGNRYLISNLIPGQLSSWSLTSSIATTGEIYLHTRRDTRWQLIE